MGVMSPAVDSTQFVGGGAGAGVHMHARNNTRYGNQDSMQERQSAQHAQHQYMYYMHPSQQQDMHTQQFNDVNRHQGEAMRRQQRMRQEMNRQRQAADRERLLDLSNF